VASLDLNEAHAPKKAMAGRHTHLWAMYRTSPAPPTPPGPPFETIRGSLQERLELFRLLRLDTVSCSRRSWLDLQVRGCADDGAATSVLPMALTLLKRPLPHARPTSPSVEPASMTLGCGLRGEVEISAEKSR
jgi:hypothetical protein